MDAIESRLENAKLASAMDDACRLPDNCEIVISLSHGVGGVTLLINGEEQDFQSEIGPLSVVIREAIEYAKGFTSIAAESIAEICRLKGTVETIRLLVSSTDDDDEIVRMKIIEMITE
jgi:hypothetical protein